MNFSPQEHTGRVFRLQFDEFQIVSSSHDDTILVWDFLNCAPGEDKSGAVATSSHHPPQQMSPDNVGEPPSDEIRPPHAVSGDNF